ncbi:hypothetical protein DFH08DRAFT_943948 [Mycena albidolilacea]|uniref:Uncharacterized protein n=1 Tax=Mycena albidolilacea TaxID=1033008 RepID=A0AAD6Z8D3_9AGAR|nr:hypothetical protein DFH08DRAFT_943948 [Mycena albidolilacea]
MIKPHAVRDQHCLGTRLFPNIFRMVVRLPFGTDRSGPAGRQFPVESRVDRSRYCQSIKVLEHQNLLFLMFLPIHPSVVKGRSRDDARMDSTRAVLVVVAWRLAHLGKWHMRKWKSNPLIRISVENAWRLSRRPAHKAVTGIADFRLVFDSEPFFRRMKSDIHPSHPRGAGSATTVMVDASVEWTSNRHLDLDRIPCLESSRNNSTCKISLGFVLGLLAQTKILGGFRNARNTGRNAGNDPLPGHSIASVTSGSDVSCEGGFPYGGKSHHFLISLSASLSLTCSTLAATGRLGIVGQTDDIRFFRPMICTTERQCPLNRMVSVLVGRTRQQKAVSKPGSAESKLGCTASDG